MHPMGYMSMIVFDDFRIEETNTLNQGGMAGASNTLGAALYVVDFTLAMLKVRYHKRYR
jgi:hypothetical protein